MSDKTKGNIGIGSEHPSSPISFYSDEEGKNKEIMKLEKGSFFWKGEEVKDVNKIYERFSEWMNKSEL